ncbi:S8 family serine peptidase [Micromonospora sp. SL1-18]|uniref:S8 family serine peptidase n=1 Tax=Micromonospora sp. SL1-18 TaxID=3399128 RepID=UPI003A4E3806
MTRLSIRGLVVGAVAVLAASMLAPLSAPAHADPKAKIHPRLAKQLSSAGAVDFWVRFDRRVDLTRASAITDWAARGEAVMAELRQAAESRQRDVRARLDAAKVSYEPLWATNAIYVHRGSAQLAADLAARAEVSSLSATTTYALPEVTATAEPAADGVEWGVAAINADDVWQTRGVRGEGIVVANIDSGVQYDHPALAAAYRGKSGAEVVNDYNWYDPLGACVGGSPCDDNGHGTHTMGTMAGDGGIGVAPGARWIAAKGCTKTSCPDLALIKAGQWMLAPTDASGQNPKPALRPNVINNSWGSDNGPVEDPFYDDVINAWTAAGIFPAFAVGNAGPACDTAGSPGDSASAYAVGAFSASGAIAPFSSKGPGAGGAAKPDITAPGVNIRSSLPGSSYGVANGTSMAAPHVAGAVALLWSAASQLIGDIQATEALLDDTAIGVADTTCGGTATVNNTWGHGKLDILTAVNAGPSADTGQLGGVVTNAATGKPLAGASIRTEGPSPRTMTSVSDGSYLTFLEVGTYRVTVSAYGYRTVVTDLTLAKGEKLTENFALTPLPMATVRGTITDDSGQGWPLAATIQVNGRPAEPVRTDPYTGAYSIDLPKGAEYAVHVTPLYPGYPPTSRTIAVDGDMEQDFPLTVDPVACTAAGYRPQLEGTVETFDTAPEAWTVKDNTTGGGWRFDDPGKRGNLTGGTGGFAIVDGSYFGSGKTQDSELISPVHDLSQVVLPEVVFDTRHNTYGSASASVDYTLDGGQTWTTVWRQTTTSVQGHIELPLPELAGKPAVQIRFRYKSSFGFWWQIDNAALGARVCAPVAGGLVGGRVVDRNTGGPVAEARVTTAGVTATTGLDGSYWLFAPAYGEQQVVAAKDHYQPDSVQADIVRGRTTRVDLALSIGRIEFAPAEVTATVGWGGHTSTPVNVTNTGSAPATVTLTEHADTFGLLSQPGAPLREVKATLTAGAPREAPKAAGQEQPQGITPSAAPWQSIADYPVTIQDNAVWLADGKAYSGFGFSGKEYLKSLYAFDPGKGSWERRADATVPRAAAGYGTIDGRFYAAGGWISGGGETRSVEIYNPLTNTWSAGAEVPKAYGGVGSAVLDGKLYVIGGCADSCGSTDVFAYDAGQDRWTRVAPYPEPVAWLGCGGIDGKVYCSGGLVNGALSARTYAYDPDSDAWTRKADRPAGVWGASSAAANGLLLMSGGAVQDRVTNAGYAYQPSSDTWSAMPNANFSMYRSGAGCGFFRTGGAPTVGSNPWAWSQMLPGFDQCDSSGDVSWLDVDKHEITLAPGESATMMVSTDAAKAALTQPGTLRAALGVQTNTPYPARSVPVAVTVEAPNTWGKLTGVVSSGGEPVAGAVVQITGKLGRKTLTTDGAGRYAVWLDKATNPVTLIVAGNGYQAETAETRIKQQKTVTVDFSLTRS